MKDGFLKRLFCKKEKGEKKEEQEQILTADGQAEQKNLAARTAEQSADKSDLLYMRVSFATDRGRVRRKNEDNFYIDGKYRRRFGKNESDCYIELSNEAHIYGLFDGMGGEAYGETASALAALQLERISDSLREADSADFPFYMNEFARAANSAIRDMLAARLKKRGGSTFAAICIKDSAAYPFYIGDSRIYLFDENGLLQITEDHTLAVRKIKAGVYTEEEAKGSPDSHKLTCFLGADSADVGLDAQPCMPVPLKPGTKLLLCSDGLYDMCTREEIAEILSEKSENHARRLAEKALKNGGIDNVTCIVIEADELFS